MGKKNCEFFFACYETRDWSVLEATKGKRVVIVPASYGNEMHGWTRFFHIIKSVTVTTLYSRKNKNKTQYSQVQYSVWCTILMCLLVSFDPPLFCCCLSPFVFLCSRPFCWKTCSHLCLISKTERDSREQLFIWGIYSLGEDGFLAKTKLFTAGSSKGICSSVSISTDVACCIYNFHIVFHAQYLPVCARWPST